MQPKDIKGRYNSFRRGKKSVVPSLKRDLSIEDMIPSMSKAAFGFEGYTSPNNKQMLKEPFKVKQHPKLTIPRVKKDTYITE